MMMNRTGITIAQSIRIGIAAFLCLLLTGCYLPDRFKVELTLEANGDYLYTYSGELLSYNFLRKIGQGEATADDKEQIDIYANDLKRDSSFKKVTYIGNARYRVVYEKESNILERRTFSFVSRRSPFLTLKQREDGAIEITGNRPAKQYRDELIAKGFDTRGTILIRSKMRSIEDNADESRLGGEYDLYAWVYETIEKEVPKLVMIPGG